MNYFEEKAKNILMEKIATTEDNKKYPRPQKEIPFVFKAHGDYNKDFRHAAAPIALGTLGYAAAGLPDMFTDAFKDPAEAGANTARRQALADKYLGKHNTYVKGDLNKNYKAYAERLIPDKIITDYSLEKSPLTGHYEPITKDRTLFGSRWLGKKWGQLARNTIAKSLSLQGPFAMSYKDNNIDLAKRKGKPTLNIGLPMDDALYEGLEKGYENAINMPERIGDKAFYHEMGHIEGYNKGNLFHKPALTKLRGYTNHPIAQAASVLVPSYMALAKAKNIHNATSKEEVDKNVQDAKRNVNILSGIYGALQAPTIAQELEASYRGARIMNKELALKGIHKAKMLGPFVGVPTYIAGAAFPIIAAQYATRKLVDNTAAQRLQKLQGQSKKEKQ